MAGARVLGMVFGFIGSVYAIRCLGARNLGLSGMVQNIVAQGSIVLGVIYFTVLVREYKNSPDDESRNRLIRVSTTFRLAGSLVFCAVGAVVMGLRLVPADYHFAGWFFIPLLLLGTLQPAWVFQAAEKQHLQSMISVLQPGLTAALYICLFKPGMSAGADLAVISSVTAVLTFIYWRAVYSLTPMKGSFLNLRGFKKAWELILQSRWLFAASIAIYVFTTLEQPLLGWLSSVEELGKYMSAVKVMNIAAGFFGIVSTILYPRFIEWQKIGEEVLWRRQLKLFVLFGVGGGLACLLGFFLIPFFYTMVFGKVFTQAGFPCAILVTSKFVATLGGVFYWGLLTKSRYDRFTTLVLIGVSIPSFLANYLLIPRWGMLTASSVNLASETLLALVWAAASWVRIRQFRNQGKV